MTKQTLQNSMAVMAVAGLMASAPAAFADADSDIINGWAVEASQSVDDVMVYPRLTIRGSGIGSAAFRVTVNRDGDVIASKQTRRITGSILNIAAKRVVKRADFPALPESYEGDKLTFLLRLNYGVGTGFFKEEKSLKPGRVRSRQIASTGRAVGSALKVIAE